MKKISVITIAYNSAETIEATIRSVLAQDYPNIEYIIVDGASKDGTMDIVHQFGDSISKIISEPDKGIYDAMNKGVELASGDVVAAFGKGHERSMCFGEIEYPWSDQDAMLTALERRER